MDNNFCCSWLFFYSQSKSKSRYLDLSIEIESDFLLKKQLCSSIPYIECGKNLNFILPNNITKFHAIFNYLSNHKGKIIDKLTDQDQQSYINFLENIENFSVMHHISIIKCYMMAYVCELAPLMRIRKSFVAMEIPNNIDQDEETFRNIQKHLINWVNISAVKGLQKLLQKSIKMFSESDTKQFISSCSFSSQLVYCMFYYAQTKMIQYTILVPDVNTLIKNEPCSKELSVNHSEIVLKAFFEICNGQDAFPIHSNKMCSISMENIQATLAIALVFHWIFGNSLKQLESILKMSSSINSSKSQNRPTSIFINTNTQKLEEIKPKTFYIASSNGRSKNDGLNQIFTPTKAVNVRNLLDETRIDNKSNTNNGDSSPEIFLTPTEEEPPITFTTPATNSITLLSQKPTSNFMLVKQENPDHTTISLKTEFQKKQQQKLNLSKSKVTLIPANETTWLAQKERNEITTIPLTPKKITKSLSSPSSSDFQRLTKAQLNELQIQMGLQRQKIQNNLKKSAKETEQNLKDSKQKAFFKVLNKTNVHRRKSLESDNSAILHNKHQLEKRLSLFVNDNTTYVEGLSSEKLDINSQDYDSLPLKNDSKDILNLASVDEKENDYDEYEENINEIELPQSLQEADLAVCPVQIIQDQINEIPIEENNEYPFQIDLHLNYIPEVSLLEEASGSRKNSSTSISSLSSISNKGSDKLLLNQEEYYKSINILNQSLSSLQLEIRQLSQQQQSWNKHIIPELSKREASLETSVEVNKQTSENQSIPETPTNNMTSLTEITNFKTKENMNGNILLSSYLPTITSHKSLEPCQFQSVIDLETSNPCNEVRYQHSLSLCDENDANINHADLIKLNSIDNFPCSNQTPTVNKKLEIFADNPDKVSIKIEENNNLFIQSSLTSSSTDDDVDEMNSSTDSSIVSSNIHPITFVISTDQEKEEARRKKAELLELREEKRRIKMESLKQKREQDRENRLSATIDELLEREEKKRQEKEKRDSLLQKYLDRKKSETSIINTFEKRSASAANTPVKVRISSKTPRPVAASGKQDSVGNLLLASSQRNTWFSSMRISNKNTSQSTSKLNENMNINSNKFGVPLPPQEYTGPKLFGKRKVKTNRSVIVNAISHCCLAGSVNETVKESVLKDLSEADGTHFMILFRDARCQYRAVYSFNLITDELNLVSGSGPKKIIHDMVEKFYKYNSGAKQFNIIISTKHLSPAVDAICIQAAFWNARPGSQIIQNAVSIANINQSKSKKSLKNISTTN